MSRFSTLLQREWMQHHRGWLTLILMPPALGLLLLVFADSMHIEPKDPLTLMLGCTVIATVGSLVIAWLSLGFQASGLARRDVQDRSIEFWLSLPVGHSASIGATLLFHGLLMPLLALGLGFVASQLFGVALVALTSGPGAVFALPWAALLKADIAGLLRVLLGVLLASVWLLPFWLPVMAASAWLKRWGLPVLAVVVGGGHLVLSQVYGIGVIGDTLHGWGAQALRALAPVSDTGFERHIQSVESLGDAVGLVPQWAGPDAWRAVSELAHPLLPSALLLSAACFGLLVLRRQRSD
jgi:hypothetical protein